MLAFTFKLYQRTNSESCNTLTSTLISNGCTDFSMNGFEYNPYTTFKMEAMNVQKTLCA